MPGYEIRLNDTGMFEIPSITPSGRSLRVGFNNEGGHSPWIVMELDEMGVKWKTLRSFHDLDAALRFSVCLVTGEDQNMEFDVRLPCGSRFKRPGRVAIEQVMASQGWMYVQTMNGYSVLSTSITATELDARKEFFELIQDTQVQLGSVDLIEEKGGQRHWCADVSIPYGGFIHKDRIEIEFKACFAMENVPVINEMDYRARVITPAAPATIVDFKTYRDARLRAAA